MRYSIIFIMCSLFLFCSCKSQEYIYKNNNIEINLKVHAINKIDDNTYKIKGIMCVKNLTENTYSFDLRNVNLKTEKNIEYKIYIDSIATRLIEPQQIKTNSIYSENIYWIIYSDSKIVITGINYFE